MIEVKGLVNPLGRLRGTYYGWWLAGVAAIIMALGTVPLFQGLPVWNPVLKAEFGWTATQLALASSLIFAEGSIVGPISGYFIDKVGPRRMVLTGLLILGGGFLLFSWVENLWMFYLAFVVMMLGANMGTWLPMMTVLNNWFLRRRSMAMAVALEGFAVGGIVLIPLIAWAIGGIGTDEAERFGWRYTTRGLGVLIMLVAIPVSSLVRTRPEEYGLRPDGDAAAPRPTRSESPEAPQSAAADRGFTWQQALRTRAFWLISLGHGCSSTVVITITVHLGLMLDDRGYSLQTISLIVSAYIGIGALFIPVGGYIGDRVPIRRALFAFSALQSVAMVVVVLAHNAPMIYLFAVLLGIGSGGRTPLTTSIRGVYFGRRAFASITGMSQGFMYIFLFAGPLFAGYIFDRTGSYNVPFITLAVVCFLGSGLFLLLGDPKPSPASPQPTR